LDCLIKDDVLKEPLKLSEMINRLKADPFHPVRVVGPKVFLGSSLTPLPPPTPKPVISTAPSNSSNKHCAPAIHPSQSRTRCESDCRSMNSRSLFGTNRTSLETCNCRRGRSTGKSRVEAFASARVVCFLASLNHSPGGSPL
jgi:hypothetical protein